MFPEYIKMSDKPETSTIPISTNQGRSLLSPSPSCDSLDISVDVLRTDCDKKNREIRTVKKEMAVIIKENQKLQTELRTKNETINSLINQNFTELKSLQDKHEKLVSSLTSSYDTNIRSMQKGYNLFRSSFHNKLKDSLETHYKLNNEKLGLLINEHNILGQRLASAQNELLEKQSTIDQLTDKHNSLDKTCAEIQMSYDSLDNKRRVLESSLAEAIAERDSQTNKKVENEKLVQQLGADKEKLFSELASAKQEIMRNTEMIRVLTTEYENVKSTAEENHSKHLLLLNDNVIKQNNIDEKTLDILSLNSKINELEKKNTSLETVRGDLGVKISELLCQIDMLQLELLEAQKLIHQLKSEKDVIFDEKNYYARELEQFRIKLRETEASILEKIKLAQDTAAKDKEKYAHEQETKFKEYRDKSEKQIAILRGENATLLSDKEKQIDALTTHIKSYTDSQYITLNELEKIKLVNEKLRLDHMTIDQRIIDLTNQHRREVDEIRQSHKKEKDVLVESYNETVKKSQEINESLQTRLNQTIEALTLSKTAISKLKENNQHLEKQMVSKESEDGSMQEKYNEIKSENLSLREKLDRSIELNNAASNKEKQYDTQIKQLQAKCAQLINLTKNKNINSVTQ